MTRRFAVTAVLALALGALPVLAQGRGPRGGGPPPVGPGPGIMPMLQHLDLTDTQKEQIHALLAEGRPSGDPGADVRRAEQKLHAQIFSDAPDPQAIETLKASLNAAHTAELDHQVEMMQKIAQILTPDQRQQLLKMQPPPGPPRGRGPGRGDR